MKVVHVITGLHTGGAEIMLHKLLLAMDRRRFRPEVVSLIEGGEVLGKIEDAGIPVHVLGMRRGLPTAAMLLELRRLARATEPDIIQGWMYHGNLAGTLLEAFAPGKPRLFWNIRHSVDDIGREKPMTRLVIRLGGLLKRAPHRVIYNSGVSLDQHNRLGYPPEKGLMIPNGFDLNRFCPSVEARARLRGELGLAPDTLLVGVVARRHPMKGHEEFLKAAAQLRGAGREVGFVLAGRGVTSEDPVLRDLANRPGLEGMVHLLGQREDMPSFFPGLDLLCVPSLFGEGFPNVLGEAMACGVPCVATDVGESREIIGDTGRIVKPGDVTALAGAMGELLDLTAAARSELESRCRGRILEKYSLEKIMEQYAELYSLA
jgi:glycosyltransferase involved in cell wall biosynthesis